MDLPSERKIKLVDELISVYTKYYTVVPLRRFAHALADANNMSTLEPKFRSSGSNTPATKNLL